MNTQIYLSVQNKQLPTDSTLVLPGELPEVPSGYLHHAVVQAGLEARSGGSSHRVPQSGQRVAQGQLGRHVGQRVAGGLAGQGRGAGQTGVDLNDVILVGRSGYNMGRYRY